jgi:hypothetical protein
MGMKELAESVAAWLAQRRIVRSTVAHGRIVASEYWGKIYTVVDAVRLNRSDGSMVRVTVPFGSADPEAERNAEQTALEFVRTLLPVLSKHLDGQ